MFWSSWPKNIKTNNHNPSFCIVSIWKTGWNWSIWLCIFSSNHNCDLILTNETRNFEWSLLALFVFLPRASNDPTQNFGENTNKKHQFCFSLQTKLFRCEDIFVSKQKQIFFPAITNTIKMQSFLFSLLIGWHLRFFKFCFVEIKAFLE